jgi:hypothetical protein
VTDQVRDLTDTAVALTGATAGITLAQPCRLRTQIWVLRSMAEES